MDDKELTKISNSSWWSEFMPAILTNRTLPEGWTIVACLDPTEQDKEDEVKTT